MSKKNSTYLYFLKVASIPILILGFLGLSSYWVYNKIVIIQNQQKQVSEVVHNTIQELAKKDLLLPDIVFIQGDTAGKSSLIITTSPV